MPDCHVLQSIRDLTSRSSAWLKLLSLTAYLNVQPKQAAPILPEASTAKAAPTYSGYLLAIRVMPASAAFCGLAPPLISSTICSNTNAYHWSF